MPALYNAIVHPWQCDVMGHLNVRHYMAAFDDAGFQLLSEATGWDQNDPSWSDLGWADVSHHIEYKTELAPGAFYTIIGSVSRIGTKSFSALYEMKAKRDDAICASLEATIVMFDLKIRKAVQIPDHIRDRVAAFRALEASDD